jgi:lipopolysaccharide/colanic/teichoic acid biosynthesis glycosyltransferase
VELLTSHIDGYALRHTIKPGITGWAQVNYGYGASVADARIKLQYDLEYMAHQSWRLDLLILLRTFRVLWKGR